MTKLRLAVKPKTKKFLVVFLLTVQWIFVRLVTVTVSPAIPKTVWCISGGLIAPKSEDVFMVRLILQFRQVLKNSKRRKFKNYYPVKITPWSFATKKSTYGAILKPAVWAVNLLLVENLTNASVQKRFDSETCWISIRVPITASANARRKVNWSTMPGVSITGDNSVQDNAAKTRILFWAWKCLGFKVKRSRTSKGEVITPLF